MTTQDVKRTLVFHAELARHPVDDAQGAESVPLRGYQRGAGVEADIRFAQDKGVVGEARVLRGVANDEEIFLVDGMSAEGDVARGLCELQADFGLEPLTRFIDQGDQRDRRLADVGREFDQIVEQFFRRRVEHIELPQLGKPPLLIGGSRRFHFIAPERIDRLLTF